MNRPISPVAGCASKLWRACHWHAPRWMAVCLLAVVVVAGCDKRATIGPKSTKLPGSPVGVGAPAQDSGILAPSTEGEDAENKDVTGKADGAADPASGTEPAATGEPAGTAEPAAANSDAESPAGTAEPDTATPDAATPDTDNSDAVKADEAKTDSADPTAEPAAAASAATAEPAAEGSTTGAPDSSSASATTEQGTGTAPASAGTDTASIATAEGTPTGAAKGDALPDTDPVATLAENTQNGRRWNQWSGSSLRNNTPEGTGILTDWNPGEFDRKTGEWKPETAKNIKWVSRLGSQTYGNPVVADDKVFVGTNNGGAYLARYPANIDLGCLLAFNEADGKFLWQHTSEKLPTGRVHDYPQQGICCAPLVEGERLWFVSSRGHVICLDTEGFHDNENDGPFQSESPAVPEEADTIWTFDMMAELKVSQHNMCSCSVTCAGDILFVCTSNGVDESHINIPSKDAPSFLAMDKNTGEILWQDNSPGANILHGQWSSPTYAVLGGVPQVLFAGGDGWLYSFLAAKTENGKPELLWKFDANPKESKYILGGRGTRNEIIATPVIYNGWVYLGVGQDPEHGEGIGHLWCIDPTRRGDVSPELAFSVNNLKNPIPHRRLQAVIAEQGEVARPNPNSALIWHYSEQDWNQDGEIAAFEEKMHRTCGTVTIKNDLLFLADFSGLFHCVDAITGKVYWTHDLFAANWNSAMIVEDKVYIGDEEGKVTIFKLSKEKEILGEVSMGNSVYTTPVVANNVLYIANKSHLFAIAPPK